MGWLLFSNLKKQVINLHKNIGEWKKPDQKGCILYRLVHMSFWGEKKILGVETLIIVMGLKERIFNQGS